MRVLFKSCIQTMEDMLQWTDRQAMHQAQLAATFIGSGLMSALQSQAADWTQRCTAVSVGLRKLKTVQASVCRGRMHVAVFGALSLYLSQRLCFLSTCSVQKCLQPRRHYWHAAGALHKPVCALAQPVNPKHHPLAPVSNTHPTQTGRAALCYLC